MTCRTVWGAIVKILFYFIITIINLALFLAFYFFGRIMQEECLTIASYISGVLSIIGVLCMLKVKIRIPPLVEKFHFK